MADDHDDKNLDELDDSAMVARYIERLMTLDQARDKELDEDDLREVALELGLSDQDLAQVDASVSAHRKRGENFLAHGSHDDAIAELRQAMVLRPLDPSLACVLGQAYHARSWARSEREDGDDRLAAEKLARRAIALDADCKPAYRLLQDMREGRAVEARRVKAASSAGGPSRAVMLAGLVVLALLGAGAGFFLVMAPAPVSEVASQPAVEPVVAVPKLEAPVSEPGLQHATIPAGRSEYEVPMVLSDSQGKAAGLRLEVERSQLQRYTGQAYSYTLRGTITVSGQELHELRVRLDLLSADNRVLVQEYHEPHGEYRPPLRPGDSAQINILVHEKRAAPPITGARLVIDIGDRAPAADDYGEAPELPLEWAISRPAHIEVEVRERQSQVKQMFNGPSHWLVLEYHNRGKRPIRGLKARTVWLDSDGQELARDESLLVSTAAAALPGGQTWVKRIIGKFPKNTANPEKPFARYAVTIIEAD